VTVRIDKIVTSGTFSLDGGDWAVDNNVWIVGNDNECVVLDAPHDADAILAAIGGRRLVAILCTHAHNDHVNAAVALSMATNAPIWLHPDDRELWAITHPDHDPDAWISEGDQFPVAGTMLRAMHTPGHTWGSVCYRSEDLGCVFTGDTLFQGGPGATGRSFSDHATIVDSISRRLFTLPSSTQVHTGHGDDTTIAAETG
jgi:glyoxylase-like metal-dependent hydrolase (beta-lactamase superfamily II)